MKHFLVLLLALTTCSFASGCRKPADVKFFGADDPHIHYVGRVYFADQRMPRIWAPGAYIIAKFKGTTCQILMWDEAGGANHNYLEIVIDGKKPYRIKLTDKENVINVPPGLTGGEHTLLICKDTESNIGYIDFEGLKCEGLLNPPPQPKRKIEYFGDSITSGAGMDPSAVPCGAGQWYDEHNAYMSYGALTSRNLDAQWVLTSLAGVGLVHSCCNMKVLMPEIYDKVDLIGDSITWNFNAYKPDVVTVCLGQNDGDKQDSAYFCSTYIKLVQNIRNDYPQADIVCLTSPMGDETLTTVLKKYLAAIVGSLNNSGDKKVSSLFFSKSYNGGCAGHPNLAEHVLIANELTAYIRQLKGW